VSNADIGLRPTGPHRTGIFASDSISGRLVSLFDAIRDAVSVIHPVVASLLSEFHLPFDDRFAQVVVHTVVVGNATREPAMISTNPVATPSGHTPEGGVLVGDADAGRTILLFEDPQCPYCRQFEELNGPLLVTALEAGSLAVEYRMRCFLGPESVRADNALALAAETGWFDELRRALFAAQPPEGTGGFTTDDLLRLGAQVGLTGSDFVAGVQEARYEEWVLSREAVYQAQDPQGTPAAWLNGNPIDSRVLFDTLEFERRIRIR
jgi:protein-disulfide isomerase